MTSRAIMIMHQAHTGALVGQSIHRNGLGYRNALPLLSEEDVLDAFFMYVKLEKHRVDQLRRWLACRGIKKSWKSRC